LESMRAVSHSRFVLLFLGAAFVAFSLGGCRNRKEEARQKAELSQSLDQFKAQIGELQKQAALLRARFDKLPEDLPGIDPVRNDLHAVEEGLGVEGGRASWLADKLDKAFDSGKKEEIEAVRTAMPQGDAGIAPLLVRVAHQLAPLERLASQRRFFEELDAKNAAKAAEAKPETQKERSKKAH